MWVQVAVPRLVRGRRLPRVLRLAWRAGWSSKVLTPPVGSAWVTVEFLRAFDADAEARGCPEAFEIELAEVLMRRCSDDVRGVGSRMDRRPPALE